MRSTNLVAGVSIVAFAILALISFLLESVPAQLGFEGDDPASMVRFVRENPDVFPRAGAVLILMSITLTIGTLAALEALSGRANGLALRIVTAFGSFAAVLFLVHGAMRIASSGPVLFIAGMREEFGEGAYLAVQMAGVHGVGVAGILALSLWATGLSLIGVRSRAIPLALALLGILPALRLASVLGPLGLLPDSEIIWLISLAAIFGLVLWTLLFGLVLLARGLRAAPQAVDTEAVVAGA